MGAPVEYRRVGSRLQRVVLCQRCHTKIIVHRQGKPPTYCRPCKRVVEQENCRRYRAKKRALLPPAK